MINEPDRSISLSQPYPTGIGACGRFGLALLAIGLLVLVVAAWGGGTSHPAILLWTSVGFVSLGSVLYIVERHLGSVPGVRNNHVMTNSVTSRGLAGWMLGIVLTGLYVILYWFPELIANLITLLDPLSQILRKRNADQWFLYGTIYTLAVIVMGTKAIMKYRHSRYQIVRISVIIFAQLFLAFLIPQLLQLFNEPEFYFSYFWPLKYDYLFPGTWRHLADHPGALGTFMVFWATLLSFIGVPALTYFFGKRWYCSWVCGCGGLANTAGDAFRHLSSKSLRSWRIERWMVHGVFVLITLTTSLLWLNSYAGGKVLGEMSYQFSRFYGFAIGAVFSGVIGVGFYPLMGTRVWCRFGCPQAAILGILQKYFSRFRISTNGGQCISCGNCSTYCEMGIDVKWYAQRGQNIIRASCVGCGICSTVCPRGVLNLENGPRAGRYNDDPLNRLTDGPQKF